MRKVLIANRGEIAVRVARACRDAGLTSVAVYAEPDRDALHVRVADEAFALGGTHPGRLLPRRSTRSSTARADSGADAVHPGYGFLSENADFAQAVIDAGADLDRPVPRGDHRPRRQGAGPAHRHRRSARRWSPGTKDPVTGADEVRRLRRGARPAGRHQGGVRRRRPRAEGRPHRWRRSPSCSTPPSARRCPPSAAASASSSASSTQPRHVEAQVLADTHGNVVVVGTRDCSLQRRNQKLVEEAPAPFLTDEQRERIHSASKAICARPATSAPAPCEYLVGAGRLDLLPRGQHPAAGRAPGHRGDHRHRPGARAVPHRRRPAAGDHRGPARRAGTRIEFRINAEDPGRGFLPAPGPVTRLSSRRRARACAVDSGVESGGEIAGAFDSLLAKLIVTGATRAEALAAGPPRAGRAGRRGHGDGAAVPPRRRPRRGVHRPSRSGVHTRWIETEWDNQVPPYDGAADAGDRTPASAQTVVVEVGGRRLEVVPAGRPRRGGGGSARSGSRGTARRRKRGAGRRCAVGRLPHLADAGHHRQGRRRRRRAPWRPATWSSCSRR